MIKMFISVISLTSLLIIGCSDSPNSSGSPDPLEKYPLLQNHQPLESFQLNTLDFTITDPIVFGESYTYKIPADTPENCLLINKSKTSLTKDARVESYVGGPSSAKVVSSIDEVSSIISDTNLSNPYVFVMVLPLADQSLNSYILACPDVTQRTSMSDFQKLTKSHFKIELNEQRKNNPREIIFLSQLQEIGLYAGLIARTYGIAHGNLLPRSFDEISQSGLSAFDKRYFPGASKYFEFVPRRQELNMNDYVVVSEFPLLRQKQVIPLVGTSYKRVYILADGTVKFASSPSEATIFDERASQLDR